jgi:hypothetical protein
MGFKRRVIIGRKPCRPRVTRAHHEDPDLTSASPRDPRMVDIRIQLIAGGSGATYTSNGNLYLILDHCMPEGFQ